ncbi:translation initiation factor IF-2-like [Lutra lutra]|uniref:translation initiation factor IF-2-like n=1 Tax=Lutra lutra TaxID=9657 RepID=UPI001FD0D324|nr:translation initiation factor IF-2-like [Lutra lutra]
MTAPLQQSIASCRLFPAVSIALRAVSCPAANVAHAEDGGGVSSGCSPGRDMRPVLASLARPAARLRAHTPTLRRGRRTRARPARPHPRAPPRAPRYLRAPLAPRSAGCTPPALPARPRSAAGLEPGFPCSPLAHSLLCSPPARGGTYSGDGHPLRPFLRFSRRLGVSAALGRKSAPRAGCASLDQGLGELVAPQAPGPLPHSCRLAGRTGCLAPRQPLPFSQPRPLLPLGCARGTPVLAAAKISHQQTARESGEPETGMDETSALP